MMKKMTKKVKTIIKITSIVVTILIFLLTILNLNNNVITAMEVGLPIYTVNSIKEFDGTDQNKPVYIGYEGYVYDVSAGRNDYYDVGRDYHYLAGKDSTAELNIVGGSIIKKKYKIVGVLKWLVITLLF